MWDPSLTKTQGFGKTRFSNRSGHVQREICRQICLATSAAWRQGWCWLVNESADRRSANAPKTKNVGELPDRGEYSFSRPASQLIRTYYATNTAFVLDSHVVRIVVTQRCLPNNPDGNGGGNPGQRLRGIHYRDRRRGWLHGSPEGDYYRRKRRRGSGGGNDFQRCRG